MYFDALTKNVSNPIDIEYDDVPSKQYDENAYLVNVEGDDMNWRWVDEKTGVCWCVDVPLDAEMDSVEIVKEIIDSNK